MKRTLSLLLAVILSVFCLASCGDEITSEAYDLYVNAMKAFDKGIDLKLTMTISAAGNDTTTTMNMKGCKDAYELQMDVDGAAVYAVLVDGVMYMNMDLGKLGIQKYKQEIGSVDEFLTQTGTNGTDLPDLTQDMLKNISVEIKDGKKSFTVKLDGEKNSELVTSFAGQLDSDAKLGDIVITCTFTEAGVLESMVMSADATVAGITTNIEVKMEFNSIGEIPTISAPADADTYKSLSNLLG